VQGVRTAAEGWKVIGAAVEPVPAKPKAAGARRGFRRWRYVVLAMAIGLLLLPVAGMFFSGSLLLVEDHDSTADVMVVLGGEPTQRPPRAIELFKQGAAPVVIVSGNGDCDDVRRLLEYGGVPASAIQTECSSVSTMQNAHFCVPLLRALGAHKVILVTSWFHSRRALQCFRHFAPDLEFISRPTVADRPQFHWPNRYERAYVLGEYIKSMGYWITYGIRPF
jgi:uncharacterized SAM-binding protein YcdF (DUF218 family)